MQIEADVLEDTLVTRTSSLPGYVELCSLNAGDEFESEFSGGRVAWAINKGHAKAVAVIFDGYTTEQSIAPTLKVRVRKRANGETVQMPLVVEPAKPIYTPLSQASKPAVHIVRLDDTPAVVKADRSPSALLPVCKFDLELNAEQIGLLYFSCLSDMFYFGLHHSWTKQTFFAAAAAKFPVTKAGSDFAACCRQVNLYRALLRRAGKLG